MIKFDEVQELCAKPLSQVVPHRLQDALRYCSDYIEIAMKNGCADFDDIVLRLNGFQPLEELEAENKSNDNLQVD